MPREASPHIVQQTLAMVLAGGRGDGASLEESLVLPGSGVGSGARLRRVIVDKHCHVPSGLSAGFDLEQDRRRFHVTSGGVTMISSAMLDASGVSAAARAGGRHVFSRA